MLTPPPPPVWFQAAPEERPLFADVSDSALPGVTTLCGSPEKDWIVEVNGGGVVLGDFDGDGAADLVVVDGSTVERVAAGLPGQPPRLFLGGGDGTLARPEAPAEGDPWAMAGGRWGMGGTAGDVDGDGFLDLVVTEWGPDRLFRNRGGRGFDEAGEESGLVRDERWSTSAAFLDGDLDGDLDLFVVGYLDFDTGRVSSRASEACKWKGHAVMCGPEGLGAVHDRYYVGAGDGTFAEGAERAGLRPAEAGYGLGVITLDVDLDGDTDLYVTNDSTPNHLWVNGGDGTFEERAERLGVALDMGGKEQAGMGVAVGDANGDGRPDLFVTNFSGENNALYLSDPRRGVFRERSSRVGLGGPSRGFLGWGTGLYDLDLDGGPDFYVMNGHVYPQADAPGTDTSYAQEDHLYRSVDGKFERVSLGGGPPRVSRAAGAADLDGDGDLDLVALELDGRVRVLENRAAREGGGHWLRVRLRGSGPNTSALGARLEATAGEFQWTSEIRTAGGYQSAVPAEAHLGLGAVGELERLVVHWPSGERQELLDVAADRVLVIEQPASVPDAESGSAEPGSPGSGSATGTGTGTREP